MRACLAGVMLLGSVVCGTRISGRTTALVLAGVRLEGPELPERSGLTSDIIRVLQQVVDERGIKGRVRYDANFWTERGMNVFYIEGISTPVTALQIEGRTHPPLRKFRSFLSST